METGQVISVKLLIFNILFFILFMYAKKSTKKLGFFFNSLIYAESKLFLHMVWVYPHHILSG